MFEGVVDIPFSLFALGEEVLSGRPSILRMIYSLETAGLDMPP